METERALLVSSMIIIMIYMLLTAKYIYGERCLNGKKSQVTFWSLYILAEVAAGFRKGESGELLVIGIFFLSFSGLLFFYRKRKRFRGALLVLPIMGIVLSVEMIPTMLLGIVKKEVVLAANFGIAIGELIYEVIILGIIYWFLKKKLFGRKMELGVWERRILNANGVVLFLIYMIAVSIPKDLSSYENYLLFGGVVVAFMLILTSIIMTIQCYNAMQYKLKSQMNEYYLQMQLNHFRAYQETQTQTRRIRHDMKNHMIGMKDLYNRKKYEELGVYLEELSNVTGEIEKEYHIGNDMADAIINEKMLRQKEIHLSITGSMYGVSAIDPIDICTIFANALDNALEEIKQNGFKEPKITISVKREKRFVVLIFTNSCKEKKDVKELLTTSKKDGENHGFGIQNMRKAAEKYQGDLTYEIWKESDTNWLFQLEILLILS